MQSSKLSCHTKTASFLIKKTEAELTDSTVAHPTHSSLFGSFFFPLLIAQHESRANPSTGLHWGEDLLQFPFPTAAPAVPPQTPSLPSLSLSAPNLPGRAARAELGLGNFVWSRTECVETGFSFWLPSRAHLFCFWRGAL